VLNVLVPEVVLQGPRVVAVVGELEAAGMAKHVRVDGEWHLGGLADALDEAVETDRAHWPPAFGNEDVSVPGGNRGVAYAALAFRHRGSDRNRIQTAIARCRFWRFQRASKQQAG
jgi:hypothetical protein